MKRLLARIERAAVDRKRRAMVAELHSTYCASVILAASVGRLEAAIARHDEENAPAWSPLAEYRGGELVRLPRGDLVRMGRPGRVPVPVAAAGGPVDPVSAPGRVLRGASYAMSAAVGFLLGNLYLVPWFIERFAP